GELWACTQNYGVPGIASDGYGIMKTTDLAMWTGMLHFQDIQAPVACPAGTAQRDQGVESYQSKPSAGCGLASQLGISSTAIDCSEPPLSCTLVPVPDGAPDAGTGPNPKKTGCCDTGDGAAPGALVLGLACGAILVTRRRRSTC